MSAYTEIIPNSFYMATVFGDTYAELSVALNEKIFTLMGEEGNVEIESFEILGLVNHDNKFMANARVLIKPEYRPQP